MGLDSSIAPVRNAVYGKALEVSDAPAATSSAYVPPKWGGDLSMLPSGVARVVDGARKLFEVRTMQEHWDLMRTLLSRDVAYQAPIIATYDREDMRVAAYLAKSIAYMTLQPYLIEVAPAGYNMTTVQIEGTVIIAPKRSWLVPPSLLLPDIPIRATIKLGVKGSLDNGKVEFLDGRWHNLPSAPGFICRFNGFLMGRVMRWAEPVWSSGLWLIKVGHHTISGISRELLNVVSSVARDLPADAAVWDLSSLIVEGHPVHPDTVSRWLQTAYEHIGGEVFEPHAEQQQQQQPAKRRRTSPAAAAGGDGSLQAADGELSPQQAPMQPDSCTALAHLLMFADAVGSCRPLVRACAASGLGKLKLYGRALLPQQPVLRLDRAYTTEGLRLCVSSARKPSTPYLDFDNKPRQARFLKEVQQQVEALLYIAYKLQLPDVTEAVQGFIRHNTSVPESILHGALRPIMSPRVLDAAGGYTDLLQTLLLNNLVTQPIAFHSGPHLRHAMTPVAQTNTQAAGSYTMELADGLLGSRKGVRVPVEMDMLQQCSLGIGQSVRAGQPRRYPAQLLLGPLLTSEQEREDMLGPA